MTRELELMPILFLCIGILGLTGCQSTGNLGPSVSIRYVGSSTVANYMRDAESAYAPARFQIEDELESLGGERAVIEGRTHLAGFAGTPHVQSLPPGIEITEIGRDAIAVIVNGANPITNLSIAQLRGIFTGRVQNWKSLGGPDLRITPFIMGEESATRSWFRSVVLNGEEYAGFREISPDPDIIQAVAEDAAAIGQISLSFLGEAAASRGVRAVAVAGEEAAVINFDYPIARPLHLLWRSDDPEVAAFVKWTQSKKGQGIVMRRFIGNRVVASVKSVTLTQAAKGTLVVYTETYRAADGDIDYYPHRPYDLMTRYGEPIRKVRNRLSENDESPMRVSLSPGTYLIRPQTSHRSSPEFLVEITPYHDTVVHVEDFLDK